MLLKRPDFYGVAALCDGELAGSNFMATGDPVWAVGPITVDCAYQAAPADQDDPTVRPLTEADIDGADELSVRIYKTSRRNELTAAVQYGFSPLVRRRNEHLAGYLIPSIFGHGVAETEEDAVAIVGQMALRLPVHSARFCCPLSDTGFFRSLLKAGCRTIKLATLMAMGPYERPKGTWMPSFAY